MSENPFEACWDRLDRVGDYRIALAEIWNSYIADDPNGFSLLHTGKGVCIC